MSASNRRKKGKPEPKPSPPPKMDKKEFDLAVLRTSRRYDTVRQLIVWSGLVSIAGFGYLSIRELAGKETVFNSLLNWSGKLGVSEGVAWVGTIVFGTSYAIERRKHRKYVKETGPRMADLERRLDPGRSSSGLQSDGESPPGEVS